VAVQRIGFELLRPFEDIGEAGRDDVLDVLASGVHIVDDILERSW
jgi:hypothetical protein